MVPSPCILRIPTVRVCPSHYIRFSIKFSMLWEVYIRTRGGQTAAKFSRTALPSFFNRNWCLEGPKVYLLDEQPATCPYKKILSVSLRPEGTSMMISDNLAMLFNTTKKEVIMLHGCPQLTLYFTSLGTVYLNFDRRAAGLPDIVSRYVILTLKYLEHLSLKQKNA